MSSTWHIWKWVVIDLGIALFIAAGVAGANSPVGAALILACAFLLCGFFIGTGTYLYLRALAQNMHQAMRPIPSPPEIAWALQCEWGRSPTVEEVAAVHQMLQSEKNQALLGTGIGLGALYLMTRTV